MRPGFWRMPRPRLVDWSTGAGCAGLALGLCQLALQAPSLRLPPSLGLALVLSAGLSVLCVALVVRALLRRVARGVDYPQLLGGVLGSVALVALWGTAWALEPSLSLERSGPWLGGGLLAALVLGGAAMWIAHARATRPASAMLTWLGGAMSLASVARSLAVGVDWWGLSAVGLGLCLGLAGLFGLRFSRRGLPRADFGPPLTALAVAAAIAPLWPWWLPWLLFDAETPELGLWPPHLLVVLVDAAATGGSAGELLEVLASQAISYERLYPELDPISPVPLPDGTSLGSSLYAYGYATAWIGAEPSAGAAEGFGEIDARPGGRTLLAQSGAWMAGAAPLLGPGTPLLRALGHDTPRRSPEQLGSAASRWILDWRFTRAPTPFYLLLDFRGSQGNGEAFRAGLEDVLGTLQRHRLDEGTLVAVAIGAGAAGPRVLVVPPFSWQPSRARIAVTEAIWAPALSRSLLEIAKSDGEQSLRFPGVDRAWAPASLQ